VRVWRICSRSHQAFDGAGARRYGGRWNHPGAPVVYTSGALSLAALEYFVHVDPDIAPEHLIAISADIPQSAAIESIAPADLPEGWRRYPAPDALQDIGTAWIKKGSMLVLAVPSALIPEEFNYLVNPAHRDFRRIRINKPAPFHYDPRLWK